MSKFLEYILSQFHSVNVKMTHPGYFDHVHFCSSFFISFIFCYKYTIAKITNFGASYIYKFTNKAKGLCTCCSRIQFSLRGAARHLMGPGESPDGNRSSGSPWKLIYRNCTIFYINVQSTKEKFRLSSLFYHHILYLITKQENFFAVKNIESTCFQKINFA